MFCEKGILKNLVKFTEKRLCQILFFNKVAGLRQLYKKEALPQVFSYEFCEMLNIILNLIKYMFSFGLPSVISRNYVDVIPWLFPRFLLLTLSMYLFAGKL